MSRRGGLSSRGARAAALAAPARRVGVRQAARAACASRTLASAGCTLTMLRWGSGIRLGQNTVPGEGSPTPC